MSHTFIDLHNCELIGHIGVDSGQMMLVDPCYVKDFDSGDINLADDVSDRDEPEHNNFSYEGACNVTLAKGQAGILSHSMAAVSSTGFGDGSYPVYVEYSDEGSWGRRVKSMTIVFIDDSEDNSEDEEFVDFCESCGCELGGFEFDLCTRCENEAAELEEDE